MAREWFGDADRFQTFEWHNETFALPDGAMRVLTNAACPNQGYVLGNSIGLQGHIEMTRELVNRWVTDGVGELDCNGRPHGFIQSAERITGSLDADLAGLHRMADRIYSRWIDGLAHGH